MSTARNETNTGGVDEEIGEALARARAAWERRRSRLRLLSAPPPPPKPYELRELRTAKNPQHWQDNER